MITSKLTSKAQTTIPRTVRHHLGLNVGDSLGFSIETGRVILTKSSDVEARPLSVFDEWERAADAAAYAGL